MPPVKKLSIMPSAAAKGRVTTRSLVKLENVKEMPKRKAGTPPKQEGEQKRQVLVDITNEKKTQLNTGNLKNAVVALKIPNLKIAKTAPKPKPQDDLRVRRYAVGRSRMVSTRCVAGVESKKAVAKAQVPKVNFREVKPRSGGSSVSSSASSSASSCKSALSRLAIAELEEVKEVSGDSEYGELFVTVCESLSDEKSKSEPTYASIQEKLEESFQERTVPEGVTDFDKVNLRNLVEVGEYAMDVFEYMKNQEEKYRVDDYLVRQPQLGVKSRTQLVDWLVELQEYFELNHESLYLSVKMLDHYLSKKSVPITLLQVAGMSCLLLASKYEEKYPPCIDDLLFISDHVCTRSQLIKVEQDVLQTLDFQLGMPLSYCFLRRYARCIQLSLQDLTLARYILELSLSEYSFTSLSESKMACASLLLALKMLGIGDWTPTLEYYTGYKVPDFGFLLPLLNEMLQKEKCSARHHRVFIKYSDVSFFKVTKKQLLDDISCDGSSA